MRIYSNIFDKVFDRMHHELNMADPSIKLHDGRTYSAAEKAAIQNNGNAEFMLDWRGNGVIELTCGIDVLGSCDIDELLDGECTKVAEAAFLALEF